MDKQQATQRIVSRLRAGYGREEIVAELSRILKAPPEVVGRFVDQVAAQHPEAMPPIRPVEEADQPDWMQSISADPEPMAIATQPPLTANSDLPPNLLKLINGNEETNHWNEIDAPAEVPQNPDSDLPKRAAFVPPSEQQDKHLKETEESTKANLQELSQEVLTQLKKRRRHNDIVEFVCHETGWHWNKSQRFVARIQTQNHEKLQTGQNRLTIFVGIGIILVGLVMALNGATTIADYAKLAAFARTNPSVLMSVSPEGLIFALAASITGLGMIIGGGYGVGRAIANR